MYTSPLSIREENLGRIVTPLRAIDPSMGLLIPLYVIDIYGDA